jgi:hypothetical protein
VAYLAGYAGSAKVGSQLLSVKSWKASHKVKKNDVTSTGSGGFEEYQRGTQVIDVTLEADWDSVLYPYASPPALIPGTYVALKLYTDGAAGTPTYDIPTFIVEDISTDLGVEAIIKYSLKGCSSGSFTAA